MKINIDIFTKNKSWKSENFSFIKKKLLKQIFKLTFDFVGLNDYGHLMEISVTLTDNENMQKLNNEYRNKNKPTNVLTFALYQNINDIKKVLKSEACISFGDIIFSNETLIREAEEQGKTVENHFKHLLVHSYLHLFGYDHMIKSDEKKMESMEIEILEKMGIDNPYL